MLLTILLLVGAAPRNASRDTALLRRAVGSRLYQIAEILEVRVTSFFAGEPQQKESCNSSPFDFLADSMTMQMAREFGKMADNKTRRTILPVVEAMAE